MVDIIVPIYNAYEDLCMCIESVKKHTDLSVHRLILINDCSTDERILPFIQSHKSENIIVINNETNMGFSNNVNTGMSLSQDNDVLLLNSDTIVTENWIEKIVDCAYSKSEIGTVTPMSNSATLCSYPVMCQDNDIPDNWTVDSLARVVERCSLKMYPRITVAVGFCMFIKRETVQKVGLFDAKTYERGYGEENDFCNRAEQLGYIHVMCDDTFIYHKGTVSFLSEQKKALIDAHEKILVERYPEQMRRNSEYCNSGLDQYIRENIHIYTKANPKKKNLMYVVQADFREDAFDHVGGTQHHVRDLVMNMKEDYNVFVAARDRDYLRVTMYSDEDVVSLKYYIGEKESFPRIRNTELFNLFQNLLVAFEINLLHIHHVYGLSFDIFYAAQELDIPMMLTMHDFYYICPNVKLTNASMYYCSGNCSAEECRDCLKKHAGIYVHENYLTNWRKECANILSMCQCLIVPSESAKNIYLQHYPEIQERISVIEHGLEIRKQNDIEIKDKVLSSIAVKSNFDVLFTDKNNPYQVNGWAYLLGVSSEEVSTYLEIVSDDRKDYYRCTKLMRRDVAEAKQCDLYEYAGFSCSIFKKEYLNKEIQIRIVLEYDGKMYASKEVKKVTLTSEHTEYKYNIAFIGGMVPEKGSQKAYELICNSKNDDICWHVFGTIADSDLIDLYQKNLVKHGTYRQEDLPELLFENNIDIVCILPIWPETFCYTLSEAIYSNIPVVVTDIGAPSERVKRNGYGWTLPVDYSGLQMYNALVPMIHKSEDLEFKKKVAKEFQEISLSEMANQYKDIYIELQKDFVSKREFDSLLIFLGLGISPGKKNLQFAQCDGRQQNVELLKEINELSDVKDENDILNATIMQKDNEIQMIKKSRGYRLLEKIRKLFLIKLIKKIK